MITYTEQLIGYFSSYEIHSAIYAHSFKSKCYLSKISIHNISETRIVSYCNNIYNVNLSMK